MDLDVEDWEGGELMKTGPNETLKRQCLSEGIWVQTLFLVIGIEEKLGGKGRYTYT